jgi:hypothetical protein
LLVVVVERHTLHTQGLQEALVVAVQVQEIQHLEFLEQQTQAVAVVVEPTTALVAVVLVL